MRRIKIKFIFNSEMENKVGDLLVRADMIPKGSIIGIKRIWTITTENKLPLPEYKELIKKVFEDNGGILLEMSEEA